MYAEEPVMIQHQSCPCATKSPCHIGRSLVRSVPSKHERALLALSAVAAGMRIHGLLHLSPFQPLVSQPAAKPIGSLG